MNILSDGFDYAFPMIFLAFAILSWKTLLFDECWIKLGAIISWTGLINSQFYLIGLIFSLLIYVTLCWFFRRKIEKSTFEKEFLNGDIIFGWLLKNDYLAELNDTEAYPKFITNKLKNNLEKEYPIDYEKILKYLQQSPTRRAALILVVLYYTITVPLLFVWGLRMVFMNYYHSLGVAHLYLNFKSINFIFPEFWLHFAFIGVTISAGLAGFVDLRNQQKEISGESSAGQ